jgi:prepilin-type N-terminal cleavage/methylation domain-containing protein
MKKTAFTLIELLVVIVIIGILATISVAQFNNFQIKARNAKTTALVSEYYRAIMRYAAVEGAYPTETLACLGNGYKAVGDFVDEQCFSIGHPRYESPSLEAKLLPHMGIFPIPNSKPITGWDGTLFRGVIYIYFDNTARLDGIYEKFGVFAFHLEGEQQDCLFPVLDNDSAHGGYPHQIRVNRAYSISAPGQNTFCRIGFPPL